MSPRTLRESQLIRAWNLGYDAHGEGKTKLANPYQCEQVEAQEWAAGWRAAAEDRFAEEESE